MMMQKKIMLVLVALVSLSLGATAQVQDGGTVADVVVYSPPFTVLSADVVNPVADVITPLPIEPQIPNVGKEPPVKILSSKSVGGSSLTLSEMKIVMGGGRNFDPKTRKWGFREPFNGQKRNSFLLSWEAKRVKYGASGLPDGLKYSQD